MRSRRRFAASVLMMLASASCATAPPAGPPAQKSSAEESSSEIRGGAPPVAPTPPAVPPAAPVGFEAQVLPILEARCRPCHFTGGVMYARLPFDCPQTVRLLGTKLFSRLKNEGEQSAINLFLAQSPDLDGDAPAHCRIIGAP